MKCPKCGTIVSENDKFCEECGAALQHTEIEINEEEKMLEEEQNSILASSTTKTTKRKKNGITIGIVICVGVILLATSITSIFYPSEKNFEATELAAMIDADTEGTYNKYEGDTLYVHGYLYSDDEADYCALYSDKSIDLDNAGLDEVLLFSPADEVADKLNEIGNGSEITITGVLEPMTKDMTLLALDAQEVEIIEAEEKIYHVNSVSELLENAEQYINQNVMIDGYVDRASSDVIFMTDNGSLSESCLLIKNVEEVYPGFLLNAPYGIYHATGKFYLDKGNAALQLTELELVSEVDEIIQFSSVDDLIRSATNNEGKIIEVTGMFDGASEKYWLWNSEQSDTVGLENVESFDVYSVNGFPWITVEGILFINENGHPEIDLTYVY